MKPVVTFPSRVDAWLVGVVLAAVVLPLVLVFVLRPVAGAEVVTLVLAGTTLLVCVMLLVPCQYTLQADHLLIRCGLIRQRIAYKDITAITPSSSMLSAPALSLKRVKISYGRMSSQLVSPPDREVFMQALRERVQAVHTGPV